VGDHVEGRRSGGDLPGGGHGRLPGAGLRAGAAFHLVHPSGAPAGVAEHGRHRAAARVREPRRAAAAAGPGLPGRARGGLAAAPEPANGVQRGGDVHVSVGIHAAGDGACPSACLYHGPSHPLSEVERWHAPAGRRICETLASDPGQADQAGIAGGCQKPGPGRQIVSQDNPSGVSRLGSQAGTQAPDATRPSPQDQGSRAGALPTLSLPIRGAYPGSSPRQRAGRNETPAGTRLPLLLGGADQHLIDCHVPRPGNDVGDVRDVFGCHPLPELSSYAVDHLGPVMAGQLRRDGARLRLWSARRGEFRELVATCMRADYSWARRPGLPGYLRVHPAQVSL